MKKIASAIAASGMLLMLPLVASAQQLNKLTQFFTQFRDLISNVLIPLIFALALLVFLWGALKYFIWGGHDEDSRKNGRQLMLYSIIAFVLMISIWGIVAIVSEIFGIDRGATPQTPGVPGVSGSR